MLDSRELPHQWHQKGWQPLPSQTICNDCAFSSKVDRGMECIHPDELEVNCSTVVFCNSFQPAQEIDSPCVTFGNDDGDEQLSSLISPHKA
jgi:hypothetical protein